jgi:hypothetical protein
MSEKTDPKENDLVPVGAKALTTSSSALIKRGLEALTSQQPNSVEFPAACSWKQFGIAVLDGLDLPFGLDIQFEDLPGGSEFGRVVDSTVWINRSHPAYRRALASHSVGYHIALAVAMTLAPNATIGSEMLQRCSFYALAR